MKKRKLALIAGNSYLVIFFAAIFANFFVLESIQNEPLETIRDHHMMVRFGILAFLITVVFDVVVIQFINTSGGNSWSKAESVYRRIIIILEKENSHAFYIPYQNKVRYLASPS